MAKRARTVFIGHDGREPEATDVCIASMLKHASEPIAISKLNEPALRHANIYRRTWFYQNGLKIDQLEKRPFSTDFAFTRFLVPTLMQYEGLALFCDSDFLWRNDVCKLFDEHDDERIAVSVVRRETQVVGSATKMDGQSQVSYPRKNWSSLVLWNCGHASNARVTPFVVDKAMGQWLHTFGWLEDREIGGLQPEWNHLIGVDDPIPDPYAAHFTLGVPNFAGHENSPFADEWRSYL